MTEEHPAEKSSAGSNPRDPTFEALLHYIQESRGLDFRGYKRTSLQRRIALRMEAAGVETFAGYQSRLEVDPREFDNLLNTVLINVTSFFRDDSAWEVLKREVIPQIIAGTEKGRPIRIWSVGCASGEEPYSIAMLFAEELGLQDFCERVKIYATDLDEEALKAARQATYTPREVEGVPAELLGRYFERTAHHYVFHRDLRKCVIFGRHNVVRDAPISRIDLLVCRNLLIYLESETQDAVLPRLHYALRSDGILFLGKAETQLSRSPLFRPVEMKQRIFAKVPREWHRTNGGSLAVGRGQRGEVPVFQVQLMETVLNETGLALLVVDDAGLVILANATARHLLGVGEGDIGRPFQDLPISYRPVELRGPMEEVFRDGLGFRFEHQEYHASKADVMRLTVEARPLHRPEGGVASVLLSFADTTRLHTVQRELETTQTNLENSIEELQSANEELETTNEELQSTNEELETINEEARSSNEEMEAMNEEFRIQAEQATSSRRHLESVLRSLNGGIIVLDRKHAIQSWNRWSENTWGLRAEEVLGTRIEALDIGLPVQALRDDMAAVEAGNAEHAERLLEGVDRRGRPILCLVRVTRLVQEGGEESGLLLVLRDVTGERRKEEYTRHLGRIMDRALNEIYFLDPDTFRFVLANESAERKLGLSAGQLARLSLADVIPGTATDDIRALVAPLIARAKPEIVFETAIRAASGHTYPAEICMQYFADEAPPILVAIVHDTSERTVLAT